MDAHRTITYKKENRGSLFICSTCAQKLAAYDLTTHTLSHNHVLDVALAKAQADNVSFTWESLP